jgi:flavin-binding protein dodecin
LTERELIVSNRTYVVNEIVGTSNEDVNTAIRNGIKRANETLRHLDWFELVEVRGAIRDGEVNHYQVTLKVGFRLEDKDEQVDSSVTGTAGERTG